MVPTFCDTTYRKFSRSFKTTKEVISHMKFQYERASHTWIFKVKQMESTET